MTARILNVSDADYHRDTAAAAPSLSQSIASILVSESPLHAWLQHPRLGGQRAEPTADMIAGTALHKLLLGKGEDLVLIDAPDFRTKAAREERDEALAIGRTPMIREKYEELTKTAATIRANCAGYGFKFDGESEVAIEWTEKATESDVLCRGKIDHLHLDAGLIIDVKKTRNANPRYLQRHILELGYDIQAAAYQRAVEALRPDLAGRVDVVFLFCEIEPPYSVVPARLDGAFREIGASRWSRAVNIWGRCLTTGEWPGYCSTPIVLEAPPWVLSEHLIAE